MTSNFLFKIINGSSSQQELSNRDKMLRWAVLAGAPVALYVLLGRPKKNKDYVLHDREFDQFLVKKSDVPTGMEKPKPGTVGGPIDGFYKNSGDDVRNPVDFNTFLKTAGGNASSSASTVAAQSAPAPAKPTGPKPDQVKVLVMYGTEYGFSKEIAEKMCAKLSESGKYW